MAKINDKTSDKIIKLYEKYGTSDYIGETITQIEHALQCAYLAEINTEITQYDNFVRECMIVASLLHDIGHLIGLENNEMQMRDGNGDVNLGIVGHENIGANFLKECGMPQLVCELVGSHVIAKRYLCTMSNEYLKKLSDASRETFYMQGGCLTYEEMIKFKSSSFPELKLLLRKFDDQGKANNFDYNMLQRDGDGIAKYKKNIENLLAHSKLFI
jgi:putative nucleotidyltransferase with HDIG domain